MNFRFAARYLHAAKVNRDAALALAEDAPQTAAALRVQMRHNARRAIDHLRPNGRQFVSTAGATNTWIRETLARARTLRIER